MNKILSHVSPNLVRFNKEFEQEIDYKSLTDQQIIKLVAHYFTYAILPSFEPEGTLEKLLSIMPLSEEFVEHQHSIDKTNIIQTLQAQSEFVNEAQESMSCCGCFRNCIYVDKLNLRNPTHSIPIRDQLRNYRSKMGLPKFEQVRALIQHVVSKLRLNSAEIKTVVIQALILVERLITNSQTFAVAGFEKATR